MDFRSFEVSRSVVAATALFAVLIAMTMGLFSKNQMPVEGKVRLLHFFSPLIRAPRTLLTRKHRPSS